MLRRKNCVPKGVVRRKMHTADKSRKLKLISVVFLYSHATTVKYHYMGRETKKVKNRCWYIMHSVASKEFLFYSARYDGMQITKKFSKKHHLRIYIYSKNVFPSVISHLGIDLIAINTCKIDVFLKRSCQYA